MSHILLIEDTEDLGEIMRDILLMNGYKVTWAKDGEEGLQLFKDTQPNLVITDRIMPILNGIELTKKIRDGEDMTSIPIIMISARTSPEDQLEGIKAGASLYLSKPCSSSLLIESVKSLLTTYEK
jgi:DNA-binding response OmpR family regulator